MCRIVAVLFYPATQNVVVNIQIAGRLTDRHAPLVDQPVRVPTSRGPPLSACNTTFEDRAGIHRVGNAALRRRKALPMTETELRVIAAAAIIGLSNPPAAMDAAREARQLT